MKVGSCIQTTILLGPPAEGRPGPSDDDDDCDDDVMMIMIITMMMMNVIINIMMILIIKTMVMMMTMMLALTVIIPTFSAGDIPRLVSQKMLYIVKLLQGLWGSRVSLSMTYFDKTTFNQDNQANYFPVKARRINPPAGC